MADLGFTHVALLVTDIDASVRFYAKYAAMKVVHQRREALGGSVAWITDGTRPFVIVLVQTPRVFPASLVRWVVRRVLSLEHLGVGCSSRDEVDRLCALAKDEGCLQFAPRDSGPPVGYWAFLRDPDGHSLELSFGQEVGLTTARQGQMGRPSE